MPRYFIFIISAMLAISFHSFSQLNKCKVQIEQLRFEENHETESFKITDSLLATAKLTNKVLLSNNEIKNVEAKTDTACCTYAGQMFLTSHKYLLTKKAATRLSALQIPLSCGIPIAVLVDGKEIYRAMLWNLVSSFGNESITATVIGNSLIFVNQLPQVPDYRNTILAGKNDLIKCLFNAKEKPVNKF